MTTKADRLIEYRRDRDQMLMAEHTWTYEATTDTVTWACGHVEHSVGGMFNILDLDCPHNAERRRAHAVKYPDAAQLDYALTHDA